MILVEIGQYRKRRQVDGEYRLLQGLKFGSLFYHNYKVYSVIGGIRLQ